MHDYIQNQAFSDLWHLFVIALCAVLFCKWLAVTIVESAGDVKAEYLKARERVKKAREEAKVQE